jgi:hypothetical protein
MQQLAAERAELTQAGRARLRKEEGETAANKIAIYRQQMVKIAKKEKQLIASVKRINDEEILAKNVFHHNVVKSGQTAAQLQRENDCEQRKEWFRQNHEAKLKEDLERRQQVIDALEEEWRMKRQRIAGGRGLASIPAPKTGVQFGHRQAMALGGPNTARRVGSTSPKPLAPRAAPSASFKEGRLPPIKRGKISPRQAD